MGDKVKEFRDKNPILDFLAGFIPGVGEAQDAHDFVHAAKDKDYIGMGLTAAGLVIPGLTGGQIRKGIDLIKGRKFAKAKNKPVYTKETAPKELKVNKRDVTEMHLNDGEGSVQLFDRELINYLMKEFEKADHGTAVRIGESLADPNYGLSQSSAPLFFKMTRRWANQGKGGYFVPKNEPRLVKPNTVAEHTAAPGKQPLPKPDQKFVDKLNKDIEEINQFGFDFPPAQFIKRENKFIPGSAAYEAFERNSNNKQLWIPNIGFLKYRNGGKHVLRKRP